MQPDPLPPDVLEALSQGRNLDAIKLLRAATGLGLKEAKDVVDAHVAGRPVSVVVQQFSGTLPAEVVAALEQGQKVQAIVLLRQSTGLGLKEAKDAVDAFEDQMNPQRARMADGLAPGEMAKSHASIWLVTALLAAVAAGVFFYWFQVHG